MWYVHTMVYYSAKNKKAQITDISIFTNMDEYQKHCDKQKEPGVKEYMLCVSIYMNFYRDKRQTTGCQWPRQREKFTAKVDRKVWGW